MTLARPNNLGLGPGVKALGDILRGILEAAAGITPAIKAKFTDESLCRRCGVCCLTGVRVKDKMVLLPDLPCRHLSRPANGPCSCAVYPHRDLTGFCHRVNLESIRAELFAPDCPYVRDLPRYQGKTAVSPAEFDEIKPILRNLFKLLDKPDYARRADWDRFRCDILGLPRP